MSVVWRLDSILGTAGSARQVQTNLQRGFGHAEVGNWGTLGSVVLRVESWVLLNEPGPTQRQLPTRPIGPAATGGVQILGISCCAGSCQSVTTWLCAGLAPRLAVWQVFGLCVHMGQVYMYMIVTPDFTRMISDVFFNFHGLEESVEHQLPKVSAIHF